MKDSLGRDIRYLRVSLTDRCNLRCRYCMPQDLPYLPHSDILHYEEILRVCRVAAGIGLRTVRVTGGEPLARRNCVDFLADLKGIPGVDRVLLTTNGTLLQEHLPRLAEIGLDGVNISLDAADARAYREVTGRDLFDRAWNAIHSAVEAGLRVKINCVLLAGQGGGALRSIAALAQVRPVDVRFIEIMPVGSGAGIESLSAAQALDILRQQWHDLREDPAPRGMGPARYYRSDALAGRIGLIPAATACYCPDCNRIRLTSTGLLKPCLLQEQGSDLRGLLRSNASDSELRTALEQAILGKPARRGDVPPQGQRMNRIGG